MSPKTLGLILLLPALVMLGGGCTERPSIVKGIKILENSIGGTIISKNGRFETRTERKIVYRYADCFLCLGIVYLSPTSTDIEIVAAIKTDIEQELAAKANAEAENKRQEEWENKLNKMLNQ